MKFISKIKTALKRNAQYSQTVRELQALDNRALTDLGIARSDIYHIARKHIDTII